MANNGYNTGKALKAAGHEVSLFITSVGLNAVSSVEWEEGVVGPDTAIDATQVRSLIAGVGAWRRPSWVVYEDLQLISGGKLSTRGIRRASEVYDDLNTYDLVELHVPYPILAPFIKVPCTIYEAGWARQFPQGKTFHDLLAARGYAKADKILVTNIDMWRIFDSLSYIRKERVQYMPFSVDTQKYKPIDAQEMRMKMAAADELILFQPTRQHWIEKGNDKVFRAFAALCKTHNNLVLWAAEWGTDSQKSKALVKELGIADRVRWFRPVAKPTLIQYMNAADIILDQFPEPSDENQIWGPWGTAALEAMACSKPLLMYFDLQGIKRFEVERPPAFHALTVEQIRDNLEMLVDDPSARETAGVDGRSWVTRNHGHKAIADRYEKLLRAIV